ncbi:MAG: hypothetical protein ACK5Y6_05140 [Pseudomonadota bacterium]|jgi:hypothetical protein
MDIRQQIEGRVQQLSSAINELVVSGRSESPADIVIGEGLPLAHIEVEDDIALLVATPISLRMGNIKEMVDEEGLVNRRSLVRIRAILNKLNSYHDHVINQNGKFNDSEIEHCKQTGDTFFMYYLSLAGSSAIGVVRIEGINDKADSNDRIMFYKLRSGSGDDWTQQYILESAVKTGESVRLERITDLLDLLSSQWNPPAPDDD